MDMSLQSPAVLKKHQIYLVNSHRVGSSHSIICDILKDFELLKFEIYRHYGVKQAASSRFNCLRVILGNIIPIYFYKFSLFSES